MKRSILSALGLAIVLAFSAHALAEDKKAETKTISGKSGCAECEGVVKHGDNAMHIMLTDKAGTRWVLVGDSASYKEAHKIRTDGKTMTATFAADPVTKKGEDGKEYKEVKVSDVKVEA